MTRQELGGLLLPPSQIQFDYGSRHAASERNTPRFPPSITDGTLARPRQLESRRNQVPAPAQLKSLILSFPFICHPANLEVVDLEAFDHTPESEDGEQVQGPVAVMVEQLMKEELETTERRSRSRAPEAHSS